MTTKVKITVDGSPVETAGGTMLLDALQEAGVRVPTLCNHPSLDPSGSCRLCMVEITHADWNGWSGLVTSCQYPVEPGIEVSSASPRVKEARRTLLELYLARCPEAEAVREIARSEGLDDTTFPVEEGADKCVLCGLCTQVCQDLGPKAIAPLGRGTDKIVGPRPDLLGEDCTGCGACAQICPTGEIQMAQEDGKLRIWNRTFDIPLCKVVPERCRGVDCQGCVKACPLEIPKMVGTAPDKMVARIDPENCTGCGICAGNCPAGAIEQEGAPSTVLSGLALDKENLKGRVVVFACSRSFLPGEMENMIPVSCIGRVSPENMVECLARGADGVLLLCRDQATCPSGTGGALAEGRVILADEQVAEARLGRGRIAYAKPRPGPDGPRESVSAFKKSLEPSPLRETYQRPAEAPAGMDHVLEMKRWLKRRPELAKIRRAPAFKGWPALPVVGAISDLGKRRITQLISLVLLHSSFWSWAQVKWLCNPVLSCHSCALAWFACPVGVFVHYSGYHLFPYFAVGTVLLLGVLFARLLCGWVCPFGLLQDLMYKIPTKKITLPAWTSNVKYVVLVVMVFITPFFLGEQTMLSFCRICPAAAIQSTLPRVISTGAQALQAAVVLKLGFLAFFLVLITLSNRSFCKVFCPIGAMLAPLNLISMWKIKKPTNHCMKCDWCDKACPPQGAPSTRISKGVAPNRVMDCIFCYECQKACPMVDEVDLLKEARKSKALK